jgi:hypothetical protein
MTSLLFKKYIENHTVGELPKSLTVDTSPERMKELGYVQLLSGDWVPMNEAVRLPKGGKMAWERMV